MSDWQLIETAPKDGTKVDIWAKTWLPHSDSFTWQRFPNCSWDKGDTTTNRRAKWFGVYEDWWPTHWMPLPDPPSR
jgi:hypothetical protein